jgi:hypothetical protein
MLSGLSDPAQEEWWYRAIAVCQLRPTAPQLVPYLAHGLDVAEISQPEVILEAMNSLDRPATISALKKLLREGTPERRRVVLDSMQRLELAWPELTEELFTLAEDPSADVAWSATALPAWAGEVSQRALTL